MKKRFYVILILTIFLAACFGCQKTPDEPVVIEKNEEKMIQQAQQTKQPTVDDTTQNSELSPIQQQFLSYSPYQASFSGNSSAFDVTADAVLTLPDTDSMSIMEVAAQEFSEEMIQKIFDCTCADATMYLKDEMKTKGFWGSEMARLQQMISDGADTDGNLLRQLQSLQDEYETVPDQDLAPVKTITFQEKESAYFTYREFDARSSIINNTGRVFSVRSAFISKTADESSRTNTQLLYVNFDSIGSVAFPEIADVTDQDTIPEGSNLTYTPLDAASAAYSLCQKAGIGNMTIQSVLLVKTGTPVACKGGSSASDASGYGYKILFERSQDGVAVFSPDTASFTGELDNSAEWLYEQFDMVMNNDGIVYISWKAPLGVTNTVVADCTLLPFTEIASIFERMMQVKYEPLISLYQYDSAQYQISDVRLCLIRIAKKDSISSGLLVPSWNFFGTETFTRDGETLFENDGQLNLLLTVNAVDGTLIDPQQGY